MKNNDDKSNVTYISQEVESLVEKEKEKYLPQNKPASIFSSQDILDALDANEDGDAWLFINLFRGKFCYDHSTGSWFQWTGHYWKEDLINEVMASLDEVVQVYRKVF